MLDGRDSKRPCFYRYYFSYFCLYATRFWSCETLKRFVGPDILLTHCSYCFMYIYIYVYSQLAFDKTDPSEAKALALDWQANYNRLCLGLHSICMHYWSKTLINFWQFYLTNPSLQTNAEHFFSFLIFSSCLPRSRQLFPYNISLRVEKKNYEICIYLYYFVSIILSFLSKIFI